MRGIRVIQVILIWVILSNLAFGATIIPGWRNMAMPGIIMLKPGMTPAELSGAMVHELCHIQQMRAGRAGEDVTLLELECSCAEYFHYERIGYQPGMQKVLHYKIP